MKNDIESLRAEIDVLRETLQKIAIGKKLFDTEVVTASVDLDNVLNLYHKAYWHGKPSRARGGTERGRSLYP